ncbi:MAG: hypothetical protein JRJ47_00370 [Deltaproteobacteria bacterium]|nr:hypothetical protein [Deltaproteobacteria bacterium]
MRTVAWMQILVILFIIGYSTYALFQGDFERALLPYPILVLYYLLFARKKTKEIPSAESYDHQDKYE